MRITVVGDVLLDVDVDGRADRLSPDAPVPVLSVDRTVERAGGAGLVATLLARDGVDVTLVTALGDDGRAADLRRLLDAASSKGGAGRITLVAGESGAATPVKTRVRAADHAMVRIDEGCGDAPAPRVSDDMVAAVDAADAILVSDYGRGLLADRRLREALRRAGAGVPLVWDPHPRGAQPVRTASAVTPNLPEALGFAGSSGSGIPAASDAAAVLADRWGVAAVIVTLGSRGALLHVADAASDLPHVVPAVPTTAADTCGAGDRLAASLIVALASGGSLAVATQSAVSDAGRFLAAGGVSGLADAIGLRPLADRTDALSVVRAVRAAGGTVVATGGCFDLLHAGHARTLAAARALGDCLIVCLNSDDSVRLLKGPERPIMDQDDRRDLLLALECVDAVAVFGESTPEAVLRRIMPDIWVKGGDYVADELPETAVLAEWGARTVTVPYYPGRSTTRLAGALERVG
jgi:D-beta-D-heptose 7-phosphate kinase / D-beta-D-heptose 1-phosphate adenosyltransferase